jgi:hypothetical protein
VLVGVAGKGAPAKETWPIASQIALSSPVGDREARDETERNGAKGSLFVWLVADGWCWFVLREKYCWLVAGGWFVLR